VAQHGGRIVKTTGDGVLIEFGSVVGLSNVRFGLPSTGRRRNSVSPAERRMDWRICIHLDDVLVEGEDILGDGVNIAARLEGGCPPLRGGPAIAGKCPAHVIAWRRLRKPVVRRLCAGRAHHARQGIALPAWLST